jgi:hypothetical protein
MHDFKPIRKHILFSVDYLTMLIVSRLYNVDYRTSNDCGAVDGREIDRGS